MRKLVWNEIVYVFATESEIDPVCAFKVATLNRGARVALWFWRVAGNMQGLNRNVQKIDTA